MIIVKIAGQQCRIKNYKWSCREKRLEGALNALLDSDGPWGWDPYPDMTAAEEAVRVFKGEIIQSEELPDGPKNLVI